MSDPQPTILITESPISETPPSDFNLRLLKKTSSKPRQDSCLDSVDKMDNTPTGFMKTSLSTFNDDTFLDELAPGLRIEQEAGIIAKKLYLDDKELFKKEDIAQFLGKRGELNVLTLEKYMNHFDFSRMRLEDAFRYFCSKLFLRGESQAIDRILNQFARRYWECNHNSVFSNQDTVYTIVYSLLLLNTDLHVANINNKISKQDFVKNTLATVRACSLLDANNDNTIGSVASKTNFSSRSSSFGSESEYGSYSSHTSCNGDDLTSLLKEMYSSIKHNQIPQPFDCKPRRRSSTMSIIGSLGLTRSQSAHTLRKVRSKLSSKPSSPSINRRGSRNSFLTGSSNASIGSTEPPSPIRTVSSTNTSLGIETYGYSKSGMLIRKHLFEKTDKKAHNRQWKNCFLVVDRGDLKMFKTSKGYQRGDNSDLVDASVQMGHIPLRHSLTIALPPPGYSPTRSHVFAVQLPNGGVYLFQTESRELVQEWVSVCNYWSARESKEPMPGGVCNVDYGWKKSFESKTKLEIELPLPIGYDDHASISEWAQPTNPMISSSLSEHAQLQTLLRYNIFLETELAEHMELRSVILQRFSPKSSNMSRAFSNWERKSQHLLRELIKYQTYADSLKSTLDFLSDLDEDDSTCLSGPRHSNSDVFVPSPLRQSQRSVTAPATLVNGDESNYQEIEKTTELNPLRWAGLDEVTSQEKKIIYESNAFEMAGLEVDDDSVYELCREHLSSSESE
ncbi:hypothetical protein K7432_009156 [Basidiobolus ranarum]|uniref:Uncharacterized protein n=1 Tax=Basidiobolus ranarum TaxID=34480 RepID=A0ABR2VYD2_9FUNG